MSKISFVKGLWGCSDQTLEFIKSSNDIDSKILPKIYTFGADNYNFLKGLNKDSELLDINPMPYSDNCRMKLAVLEKALTDSPEVILVDWHIRLNGELPFNFEDLRKGSPIRAALRMYKNKRCQWRQEDQRKISASDFLYVKGIKVVKELLEIYNSMEKPVTLEQVIMKYIDHLTGKWRGSDYYRTYFEIPSFTLSWEKEIYDERKVNAPFYSLKDIAENDNANANANVTISEPVRFIQQKIQELPIPPSVREVNEIAQEIVTEKDEDYGDEEIEAMDCPCEPCEPCEPCKPCNIEQPNKTNQERQEQKTRKHLEMDIWTSNFSGAKYLYDRID